MNSPNIWQTAPEPTPEERVSDIEVKTQAYEAAVVAAIIGTVPDMPFEEAYQKAIKATEAATTQAIRDYVQYRRANGHEPLNGDSRVQACRKLLNNANSTLRQHLRDMKRLRDVADACASMG
jgi:hypothetical protein